MSEVDHLPFYTLLAEELAAWLDLQVNTWWFVDGDPLLMSKVHFPCPNHELSAELRRHAARRLIVFDSRGIGGCAHGDPISREDFGKLAYTENRYRERDFPLRWEDRSDLWLLSEDIPAALEAAATGQREEADAQAAT